MDDRAFDACQALEGPLDQLIARLGEDLDGDVVGYQVLFHQEAYKVEVGLRGGREADLDLFEAHRDQQLEEAPLALGIHGVDQGLVAVAEVDAAPRRGAVDGPVRPLPVGQRHRRVGPVLLDWHSSHGCAF